MSAAGSSPTDTGPGTDTAGGGSGRIRPDGYTPLTAALALQLAAPHTWPAAIMPVLFSLAYTAVCTGRVSATLALALLAICVLMQAAANTFNDYFDYLKGADSRENQSDPTDAVLVYNRVNPKSVARLGIAFLAAAFALGIYVIVRAGWVPLALGLLGALIVVLYSAGRTPLSYLPVGELVSGAAMGGIIPLACYQALAGEFSWLMLLLSVPFMAGIGLVMFTNNTCDIEKDCTAGRRTSAVLLGRSRSRRAYRSVLVLWVAAIVVLVGIFFTPGLIVMVFMLVALYPALRALLSSPLTPEVRTQAMPLVLNLNIALGAFYTAALFMGGTALLL